MASLIWAGLTLLLLNSFSHGISVKRQNFHCGQIHSYNVLHDMLTHDTCMSANELFTHFSHMTSDNTWPCRKALEEKFAAKYPAGTTTPSGCTCTGHNIGNHYPSIGTNHYQSCSNDGGYITIYKKYFLTRHPPDRPCTTHHAIWYDMARANYANLCQYDLVLHIAHVVSQHDPCKCSVAVTEPTTSPTVHTAPPNVHTTHAHTTHAHTTHTTHPSGHIVHVPVLPTHCEDTEQVKILNILMTTSGCHSIHTFWRILEALHTTAPDCMPIVDQLAAHFGKPATTSCACSGHMTGPNPFKATVHHHTYNRCSRDAHYLALEHFLFEDNHHCVDTSIIWSPLRDINHSGCKEDFIKMAASKYSGLGDDPCTCNNAAVSPAPAIPFITAPPSTTTLKTTPTTTTPTPTTTTSTTTRPTTTKPTTTTIATTTTPPQNYHCKKFATVQAIANHDVVTFSNMTDCTTGSGSNDGFVMQECNVTSTVSDWRQGVQVRPNCDQLPWYIPVAVFLSTTYNPSGAQTGIFAGCLANGFRMIVEKCDGQGPVIRHIEDGGAFTQDPMNYYVIS